MEKYVELVSVPAIAAIVFWGMNLIKYTFHQNEKVLRLIPLLSVIFGAICGLIAFYAVPGGIIAENVWVAMVIGAASGMTATGTHQVVKQLKERDKKIEIAPDQAETRTEDEDQHSALVAEGEKPKTENKTENKAEELKSPATKELEKSGPKTTVGEAKDAEKAEP